MKKILELGEPISATYSHAAHTLAILANEKNNRDWLMNCFIQIFGGENDFLDYQDFGFMECPLIHTQHIGIDMVDIGWKNRLDFVKMAIINNYYIYAEMNVSKIKHRLTRAHREKQLKMSCQALHNAPPNRT